MASSDATTSLVPAKLDAPTSIDLDRTRPFPAPAAEAPSWTHRYHLDSSAGQRRLDLRKPRWRLWCVGGLNGVRCCGGLDILEAEGLRPIRDATGLNHMAGCGEDRRAALSIRRRASPSVELVLPLSSPDLVAPCGPRGACGVGA
jgi:hypothetical protein